MRDYSYLPPCDNNIPCVSYFVKQKNKKTPRSKAGDFRGDVDD